MTKSFKIIFLLLLLILALLFLSGCTFTQYIAHYANSYGWRTKLTLKNSNSTNVDVTMNFYNNDGEKVSTTSLTLPAYGFKTDYVENFFPDSLPDTGSIEIISDEPGYTPKVSSIILFEHDNNGSETCMAGLQGSVQPAKYLTFPWFENSNNFTTGIAILNVSGYDIVATMRAFTEDGNIIYSKPIKLKPMQRILGFANDFFDEQIPDMSTLDVYATGKIAGFIIMYNNSITKAEAINGVIARNRDPNAFTFSNFEICGETEAHNTGSTIKLSRDYSKLFIGAEGVGIYEIKKSNLNNPELIFSADSGKIAISPDGKKLVVASTYSEKLYEIDLRDYTYKVIDSGNSFYPYSIAFSNDGNWLAVGTNSSEIIVYNYDLINDSYTRYITFDFSGGVTHHFVDIVFSPDSKYVVAIDQIENKLYYCDITSSNPTLGNIDIELDGQLIDIDATPNGEYYICDNENNICYLNGLSSTPSYFNIQIPYLFLENISISPDGKYLFGVGGSKIVKVDLSDRSKISVINVNKILQDVVYSPDSGLLYVSCSDCIGYIH